MVSLQDAYHRLPPVLRHVAASAYGYCLRWWRYGSETERIIEQTLERETWSAEQWASWEEEQMARVLHRAATKVPYYREYWRKRRRRGDRASWEVLENWPLLSKEKVRANPKAFVADDRNTRWMEARETSGTTGTPMLTYATRATTRKIYAVSEARLRRWWEVSIDQRWAIMGGRTIVPFDQQDPPFWVYNAGLNQLYLSTHHLSPQNAKAYAKALRRYAPTHAIVYPSSARVLASYLIEQNLDIPSLEVILSNAEQLSEEQRATIEEGFGCPVRNTYGMSEAAAAASECAHGTMHIWPEFGKLEVLRDFEDVRAESGVTGRLVSTALLNRDTPLIRYVIGDRGSLGEARSCKCGRTLPVLASVEGRTNDMVVTPEERGVFLYGAIFYGLPVKESQIVQKSNDHLHLRLVVSETYSARDEETARDRLRERVGDMRFTFEEVERIPRTEGGKLKFVINESENT